MQGLYAFKAFVRAGKVVDLMLPVTPCYFGASSDDAERHGVLEALRTAGVALEDARGAVGAGVALAVVGDASPEVLTRIRELAGDGWSRVLALALVEPAPGLRESMRLLEAGADDVLTWPNAADGARALVSRLLRYEKLQELMGAPVVRDNLIGQSRSWLRLLERVVEVAHFTNTSILFTGESGTGKELAARLVHTLDARPDKKELVVLDCATVVPELSGSEFFGHERGAFTGASHVRDGAFELASGGTLFLDEIGELPLPLQAQLLRVIQERTYKRVGGNQWHRTEFRLICATHRDLREAVQRGAFRHDLYHRIATWTFQLPPLRDRVEDILPLARHFAHKLAPPGSSLLLDPAIEKYLLERAYPGNVRELWHTVKRLIDRHPGEGPITVGQVPDEDRAAVALATETWPDSDFEAAVRRALALGVGLKSIGKEAESTAVRLALALESGNLSRASRRFGITDRALQLRQAERRREALEKEGTLD